MLAQPASATLARGVRDGAQLSPGIVALARATREVHPLHRFIGFVRNRSA
jgi:hypothetical protein